MATGPTEATGLEVVVVSHGAGDLLLGSLDSLHRHPSRSVGMRVTVVDSGSPDDTPDRVAREFGEVRLVRRGNIGFAAANNIVLREVLERARQGWDAPVVLLLNPDTEVYEGTIDVCLARLESDPDVGMVGCKLLTPDGSLDHACKRSFPTPLGALAHFTGIGSRGSRLGLDQYRASHLDPDEPGTVDAVNGAFMMVRPRALADVGPLDEGYWLYMEDLDWCHRFGDAGWRVFYEPSAAALHVKGGTSPERRRSRQEIAFHRGMGRFYRRFRAPTSPEALDWFVYAGIGVKLATSLLKTFVRSC